jgi:hypothetical protein
LISFGNVIDGSIQPLDTSTQPGRVHTGAHPGTGHLQYILSFAYAEIPILTDQPIAVSQLNTILCESDIHSSNESLVSNIKVVVDHVVVRVLDGDHKSLETKEIPVGKLSK